MRITKITVRGEAGYFAEVTLEQRDQTPTVAVEVIKHGGELVLRAPAGDRQALWGLASRVQARLDGYEGAGGDVRDYFDLIERVAGC
jgi:hypothetical protein